MLSHNRCRLLDPLEQRAHRIIFIEGSQMQSALLPYIIMQDAMHEFTVVRENT